MKILFGKYYGKDISELDSAYLLWIIEFYEKADWILIQECKKELSERLKLDWMPPSDNETIYLAQTIRQEKIINHLKSVIAISAITKRWNYYTAEMYLNSPKLLESDLKLIRNINQ